MKNKPKSETLQDKLQRYKNNPVDFCEEILYINPWSKQKEILEAVRDNRRVSVISANKCGKSLIAACIALWWVSTNEKAEVILTAPVGRQINVIWKEIRTMHQNTTSARNADRVASIGGFLHENWSNGLKFPNGKSITGKTAETKESFQGTSSENMLVIADEASGITDDIFEGIDGMLASKNSKFLMLGNPTRNIGNFYESHMGISKNLYKRIHISAFDSPNITNVRGNVPGLASQVWIDEQEELHGKSSKWYDVHVLGQFSKASDDNVISQDLIDKCVENYKVNKAQEEGQLFVGVDVGRFSDPTVIVGVKNNWVYSPAILNKKDFIYVAGRVAEYCKTFKSNKMPIVVVDETGMGVGLCDILKTNKEIKIIGLNAASKSNNPELYPRIRDELWFNMANWLKRDDSCLPPNQTKLFAELTAPEFSYDLNGKRKVQSKDEIKTIIKRSPDSADALALALYFCDPTTEKQLKRLLNQYNNVDMTALGNTFNTLLGSGKGSEGSFDDFFRNKTEI